MHDLALVNAGELVTCDGSGKVNEDRLGVIQDGAFVVNDRRVVWVGTTKELRRKAFGKPRQTIDAQNNLVTPGFVDPHTHLVFAGSREDELERKVKGESYTSILASGGGIL
ncbi:MAG TPA: amidohydrolase family protein, partial [Nitrososphaerales archaeon]